MVFPLAEIAVGAVCMLASARTGVLGWATATAVGPVFTGIGGVLTGTLSTGLPAFALALIAFGLGMNVGPRRYSFRWHKRTSG